VILWTVDSKHSENNKSYRVRTYAHVLEEFLKTTVFTVQCPLHRDSPLCVGKDLAIVERNLELGVL